MCCAVLQYAVAAIARLPKKPSSSSAEARKPNTKGTSPSTRRQRRFGGFAKSLLMAQPALVREEGCVSPQKSLPKKQETAGLSYKKCRSALTFCALREAPPTTKIHLQKRISIL